MAKGWTKIGDNKIEHTENNQEILNRFNAEIRNMNTIHYKKKEAEKAKAAISKAKERKKKDK